MNDKVQKCVPRGDTGPKKLRRLIHLPFYKLTNILKGSETVGYVILSLNASSSSSLTETEDSVVCGTLFTLGSYLD
jgi:hypothetical protein